jgi:hypothetical protein
MNRAWIVALLLLAAGSTLPMTGCSKKKDTQAAAPTAPAAPKPRNMRRAPGTVLTGLPDGRDLAICDGRGRWGIDAPVVEHSIVDPKEKAPLLPAEGGPTMTLYRDSLPFPQVNWKIGSWEVTQLLYPFARGFIARYHIMNHGEGTGVGQLRVSSTSDEFRIAAENKPAGPSQVFDLKIEPGSSQFIEVCTAEIGPDIPDDSLEQATEVWEKLLGERAIKVPDPSVMTNYYADVAGVKLGVFGCMEGMSKTEAMLAKREGNALRLLGGIPEKWQLEAIEVRDLATDFGPLSFRYQGVYNNRTFELKGCKPPDGFLISVPDKLVVRIDGKDAPAKDGMVHVPGGAAFVEVLYPR